METSIEELAEASALNTFFVSVVFLTISIFLLRALGRSIQKSTQPTAPPANSTSPWNISTVLMLFGFFLLGQMAVLAFASSSSPGPDGTVTIELDQTSVFIGLSVANLALSTLAVLTYRLLQKQQLENTEQPAASFWSESGGHPFSAIRLGILALLCWIPGHLGLTGLWSLCLEGLDIEINAQESVQLMSDALEQSDWSVIIPMWIYGIVLAPLAEEILFRGVLFRWLRGHWGFFAALAVSSVAFALVHDSVASWLPIAALGGLCCWLYHRSGQLLATITLHAAFNSCMFLLISLLPEGI